MSAASTETIALATLKVDIPNAHQRIAAWADACGVTVASIEQIRKGFGVELLVTVTGDHEDIDELRGELNNGRGASNTPILDILEDVAAAASKGIKRWRRGRKG
jgi:hypothetical protein